MNERIRELAINAGLYVETKVGYWPRNMNGEDIEGAYQRFGEALIRACVEDIEFQRGLGVKDKSEWDAALFSAASLIKHHFSLA